MVATVKVSPFCSMVTSTTWAQSAAGPAAIVVGGSEGEAVVVGAIVAATAVVVVIETPGDTVVGDTSAEPQAATINTRIAMTTLNMVSTLAGVRTIGDGWRIVAGKLGAIQRGVQTVDSKKLLVAPRFDKLSAIHYQDAVGGQDRREAVGDD